MKIIFMGTPDFAVPTLKKLYDSGYEVQAVFTQPDKPKGRGYKLTPPPVKVLAQEHAEHRRFGRIFKRPGRKMHPRAAYAAVHEQLCVAALRAHGQQQQVALRLLHLVDARAGQALRQLLRQAVQKNCVHWHVTAPP